MKDLISIIVPVYNREKYIDRCIKSLISQSYKNIEIICVNDGSTDNSLDILNSYAKKDKRIKIINNPQNMGIGYSRNAGIKASTAEYIMWCDSDDWFEKHTCKKMLKAIINSGADLAECSAKIIFDKENLGVRKYWNKNKDWELKSSGKKEVNLSIVDSTGKFLWNKIIKKSIITKNNLKFPQIPTHEDTVFMTLYLMFSKSTFLLQDKLYNYVIHSGSAIDNVYEKVKGVTSFIWIKYLISEVNKVVKEVNSRELTIKYNDFTYYTISEMIKEYIEVLKLVRDNQVHELRLLRKKIDEFENKKS